MGAVPSNPRVAQGSVVRVAILALVLAPAFAAGQVFRTAPTFPAGTSPFAVVVADLDGDGRADLAVASGASQDVWLLLNDGAGGFVTRPGPPGPGIVSLAAGDVDRDGRIDLVIGTVTKARIFLGSSSGGYVSAGECGRDGVVAVGDVDGDSIPDVAGAGGQQVWIARGDGAGGCANAVSHPVGLDASALALAELTGDGRPEILVADRGTHALAVLRNLGDGSFAPAATLPLGPAAYPSDLVAADFDRDGRTDVAVAAPGSEEVLRLAGDGAGGLVLVQRVALGAAAGALASADLDADGWTDLVAADPGAGDALLLRNDGVGGLLPPPGGASAGRGACDLAVGDFDGDARPDVAVANRGGPSDPGGVAILVGDGSGRFPDAAPTWLVGRHPMALAAADLDGDERTDAVTANQTSGSVSVLRATPDGFAPAQALAVSADVRDVSVGDFDRDGRPDLAATHFTGDGVSVLAGTGQGGFGAPTAFAAADGPLALDATDLDADGFLDLAVVAWAEDAVAILRGDGHGAFVRETALAVGHEPHAVALGDFDRNGHRDLAVANWGSGSVSVLLADGQGGFAPALSLPAGPQTAAVEAADIDGDGLLDLLAANEALQEPEGSVSFWRGDGAGGFAPARESPVGRGAYSLAVADVDLDGRLDVATANALDHTVSLLVGAGGGRFVRRPDLPIGAAPTAVTARDLDGDGRTDLVVAGTSSARGRVLVLRNLTPAADLALTVDDGVDVVRPGDLVTYSMTVTNRGPLALDALVLRWTSATSLAYVGHAVSAGAYDLATGAWTGLDLQPGGQVVLTLQARLDAMAVGTLVQGATVLAPTGIADPVPGDNSAQDTDAVLEAADLALLANATPDPVGLGETLALTVRAANRGPLAARDAVIDVRLPPALTFEPWPASPAECVEMDGHVTCAVGSIETGAGVARTLRLRANFALAASSVVSVASPLYDPEDDNDRTVVTTGILPGLAQELAHGYEARGPAGEVAWFRLRQAPRSSYEVVVDEAPLGRLRLERVASDLSTTLTYAPHVHGALRLRLDNPTAHAVDGEAVRVSGGDEGTYRIRVYETTGSFPRFNNEGTSATIVLLQNAGGEPLQGVLWFWGAAGALLASQPFELPAHGSRAFDTRERVAGRAGSVTVTHEGLHGDLAGKAVVVDPAGGFVSESELALRAR